MELQARILERFESLTITRQKNGKYGCYINKWYGLEGFGEHIEEAVSRAFVAACKETP